MTDTGQVEVLKVKHASLERAIDEESHRPAPDNLRITKLKREKLKIKDEIATIAIH